MHPMKRLMMINIDKLLACFLLPTFLLSMNRSVSAETVFVVGSYQDEQRAQQAIAALAEQIGVTATRHTAMVNGGTWHRLVIANDSFDEVTARQLAKLGIKPWRMNLTSSAATKSSSQVDSDWQLAGTFSNISDALEMERRLVAAGRAVQGKTEFVSNQLVHQVWTRNSGNAKAPAAPSQAVTAIETDHRTAKSNSSSKKSYPPDFNLARLPPKRDADKPR